MCPFICPISARSVHPEGVGKLIQRVTRTGCALRMSIGGYDIYRLTDLSRSHAPFHGPLLVGESSAFGPVSCRSWMIAAKSAFVLYSSTSFVDLSTGS